MPKQDAHEYNRLQDQPDINTLFSDLAEAQVTPVEVVVWGYGSTVVNHGEVAAIATERLNGCHVSIIVSGSGSGLRMSMTHFPPEIGKSRYEEALREIRTVIDTQSETPLMVASVTDINRVASETALLDTIFPEASRIDLDYDSIATDTTQESFGRCLVMIDGRGQDLAMTIATDTSSFKTSLE